MNRLQQRNFNLIEISIALGVLITGLLSVMGLFMHGVRHSQKAISSTAAAESGQLLLNYLTAEVKNDWTLVDGTGGPPPPPWEFEDEPCTAVDTAAPTLSGWTNELGPIYYRATTNTCSTRIYRVQQTTDVGGNTVVDFDALARVWKRPISVWRYDGSNWVNQADNSYTHRVQLHVELSWPAGLLMSNRSTKTFVTEVANE